MAPQKQNVPVLVSLFIKRSTNKNMKRKNALMIGLMLAGASLMSFTTGTGTTSYNMIVGKSTLEWTGRKVGGQHVGTVDLKSGSFSVDGSRITSGTFVVDMTTMVPTDTKGSDTKKLTKHLRSKDFFNVSEHPTATLKIKNSESTGDKTYKVTADMTILGKAREITFDAKTLAKSENFIISSANITIDRTKWGITYKSSVVGDAFIKDNFDVKIKIFGQIKK